MANELEVIVKESGLDSEKAEQILKLFGDCAEFAKDWESKAKTIIVTKASQQEEMKMAGIGRKLIGKKITAIEETRKDLKSEFLNKGRAVDSIAKYLKGLLEPIKEHLDKQEHYVENLIKAKEAELRLEAEKKVEEERIAKEKAEQEEKEKIRIENINLKLEAERKEKELALERQKVEAEKRIALAVVEEKARIEREKQSKILAEEKAKADNERRIAEEKARKEKEIERKKADDERKEKERLAEILKNTVECPACKHKFVVGVK